MTEQQPRTWLLWHPHQGLANGRLVAKLKWIRPSRLARLIIRSVIHVDTFLLFSRAFLFRLLTAGPAKLFSAAKVPPTRSILYLDLGTHEQGNELRWAIGDLLPQVTPAFSAVGFEASQSTFALVEKVFADSQAVQLVHAALCLNVPESGTIRLFKADNSLSDSLWSESERFEDVPAMRLSTFLERSVAEDQWLIVRMNIEGAEFDVIQDLVQTGWNQKIIGWFGMWDDLSKSNPAADRRFRRYLRRNQIRKTTFNGRDLDWPLRRKLIQYEWNSCMLKAIRQLKKENENLA